MPGPSRLMEDPTPEKTSPEKGIKVKGWLMSSRYYPPPHAPDDGVP